MASARAGDLQPRRIAWNISRQIKGNAESRGRPAGEEEVEEEEREAGGREGKKLSMKGKMIWWSKGGKVEI